MVLASAFFISGLFAVAAAGPLNADALPAELLAQCDAEAAPYRRYEPAIAASADALIAIGALMPEDFIGVRIGFCPMRRAGGPVGSNSCPDDIVLLDDKYRAANQALVLHATLAHEVTHVRQHRAKKARSGAAWCDSAEFRAEKSSLETAADEFGDAAAALIALGRKIEIVNDCAAPLLVYLEADNPAMTGGIAEFQHIDARSAAIATARAASGRVHFYARTAPTSGPTQVFDDPRSAQSRYIEGELVRLKAARLSASDRLKSPFRLRLSCKADAG